MIKALRTLVLSLLFMSIPLAAKEAGKWINPITDICWKCLFPIHVAGQNVTPDSQDFVKYKPGLCYCVGMPPKAGIPLSFWEPTYLVEVTRTPYKFPALGGMQLSEAGIKKRGTICQDGLSGRSSFYNVHLYQYPIMKWLGKFDQFSCIETKELSIPYMSEYDPMWNDDKWASILTPEAFLFSTPLAQTACIADCAMTSINTPSDKLFWCAGCSGSLYPFVGRVPHHVGHIQASHLLVQRLLAKLHTTGMLWTYGKSNYCEKRFTPGLKKTAYKTQLVYPVANSKGPCPPLGHTELLWGAGKSYPYSGEDFVYLIWTKKHCCLDAVKPSIKALGGQP